MNPAANSGKTLPSWMPATLIVACLAATLFFLPSRRSLLESQIADGQIDRALATLRQISPRDKDADPDYYALIELQLLRKKLRRTDEKEVAARFASACAVCEQRGHKPAFVREAILLMPFFQKASTVWDSMSSLLSRAPPAARSALYQALTAQALSETSPLLAARIYDEYWRKSLRTAAETDKLAQLWRQAGQPLKGLEVLESFFQAPGNPPSEILFKLERLRIDVLRETSQAGRAFDAVRQLVGRAPLPAREELFRLMTATALESNRLPEIMPELLARSQERPEDVETLQWIGQGALSMQDHELALRTYERLSKLRPGEGSHYFQLARICEWRNQMPKAFDLHMKALSLGESNAIPRLLALVRGLYREGELAEALASHLETVKRLGLEFEFARLQGRVGNFDQAVKGYDARLQQHPPTLELLKEYGQFLADLYEYEKAMGIYRKAELLDPGDFAVKRAIAELKFRLGDYAGSFQDYENLLPVDSSTETVEHYLVLAESLAKSDKIVTGLRTKLARSTQATAQVYQRLAYYQNAAGKPLEAETTFAQGLDRFPQDRMLRLQAAHFYADSRDYIRAEAILRHHSELKTDSQTALFYLNLLLLAQRHKEAEAFIRHGVSAELANSPGMLEPLAAICEAGNRIDEAAAIYARLMKRDPGNARYLANCARLLSGLGQSKKALAMIRPYLKDPPPEICQLLAQVFAAAGDYKNAEIYQKRHLASGPAKTAQAWGFLGDIMLLKGQKSQARQAYRNGYNVLVSGVGSE